MAGENEKEKLLKHLRTIPAAQLHKIVQALENQGEIESRDKSRQEVPQLITREGVWPLVERRLTFIALQGEARSAIAAADELARIWGKMPKPVPEQKNKPKTTDELLADIVDSAGGLGHEPDRDGAVVG